MPSWKKDSLTNLYFLSVERECRSRLRLARHYRIAPYEAFALEHLSARRALLLLVESGKD